MAEPLRRCRVCRRQRPKSELTRWASDDKPGRGAYFCADNDHCREIFPKTLGAKRK
jgi:predicted RNA-binding protein YlxR (DUF448 family)